MTIKIVKRGTPPGDFKYEATCRVCKSELEWLQSDSESVHYETMRDAAFTQISCPVCDARVTGYSK